MSAATGMQSAAESLEETGSQLRLFIEDRTHDWLSLMMAGPAVELARANLGAATNALDGPAQQMRAAAAILRWYAHLEDRRETLQQHLLTVAGYVDHHDPIGRGIGKLLQEVQALGEALDWACAAELSAVCDPAANTPPRRLEDLDGLSLDAVHEIALSTAPPDIAQLVRENPDVLLLEASPGRMVAVVDPERVGTQAAQVSTYVPGVGSADPEGFAGHLERGRRLATATGGPTVVWLGYRAPGQLDAAVSGKPARLAGAELARFQRSLRKRYPRARSMLIGYSYGSVVASHATVGSPAGRGHGSPVADDLVLVGSPGVAPETMRQEGVNVWAATNAGDPIALATGPYGGIHGVDPAHPASGARGLPGANRVPGSHTTYWKDPAFLRGLGAISAAPG